MKGGRFLSIETLVIASFIQQKIWVLLKKEYKLQTYDYPINMLQPKELLIVSWLDTYVVEMISSSEDRISISFNFKLNRSFPKSLSFNFIMLLPKFIDTLF